MKIYLFVCLLFELEARVHPVAEPPASLGYFFLTNVTFFLSLLAASPEDALFRLDGASFDGTFQAAALICSPIIAESKLKIK